MAKPLRYLTALPVYNEANHVDDVLDEVTLYASDILVVDDGSTDSTRACLANRGDVIVVRHMQNRGYGAALQTAFDYALANDYDVLVTIDCDGQHEPQRIRTLAEACTEGVDIVSGSRYYDANVQVPDDVPADRRLINQTITNDLNECLGLDLTDAFCGFKAYRVESLRRLRIVETGYAMPLELWVQAASREMNIVEVAVPLIYLDEERSFGGSLDDAGRRLSHYRDVIRRAINRVQQADQSAGVSPQASRRLAASPCGAGDYS